MCLLKLGAICISFKSATTEFFYFVHVNKIEQISSIKCSPQFHICHSLELVHGVGPKQKRPVLECGNYFKK